MEGITVRAQTSQGGSAEWGTHCCGGQWGCEGRVGVMMVYDLMIAPVSLYAEPLTEACGILVI